MGPSWGLGTHSEHPYFIRRGPNNCKRCLCLAIAVAGDVTTDPVASAAGGNDAYSFRVVGSAGPVGCQRDADWDPGRNCESRSCVDHSRSCMTYDEWLTTEKCDTLRMLC